MQLEESEYLQLQAIGDKHLRRHRIAGGRILSREEWAHEWVVSLWWAEQQGWSRRPAHVTGTTLKRCLRNSQPGRPGPYLSSPMDIGPEAYTLVDPSPGPVEEAHARDILCRLLRVARFRRLGRRILVRRLHGRSLSEIAETYGVSEARISQVLAEVRIEWQRSFARPLR